MRGLGRLREEERGCRGEKDCGSTSGKSHEVKERLSGGKSEKKEEKTRLRFKGEVRMGPFLLAKKEGR